MPTRDLPANGSTATTNIVNFGSHGAAQRIVRESLSPAERRALRQPSLRRMPVRTDTDEHARSDVLTLQAVFNELAAAQSDPRLRARGMYSRFVDTKVRHAAAMLMALSQLAGGG